jgi:hypothetical protein
MMNPAIETLTAKNVKTIAMLDAEGEPMVPAGGTSAFWLAFMGTEISVFTMDGSAWCLRVKQAGQMADLPFRTLAGALHAAQAQTALCMGPVIQDSAEHEGLQLPVPRIIRATCPESDEPIEVYANLCDTEVDILADALNSPAVIQHLTDIDCITLDNAEPAPNLAIAVAEFRAGMQFAGIDLVATEAFTATIMADDRLQDEDRGHIAEAVVAELRAGLSGPRPH